VLGRVDGMLLIANNIDQMINWLGKRDSQMGSSRQWGGRRRGSRGAWL